jgi:hypothetical protein
MEGKMAFREKMAWTTMVSSLLVWGWYFILLVRGLQAGGEMFGDLAGRFAIAVALLVVIQIVAAIAIAIANPREADAPADDRERGFALVGYRNAYVALYLLVIVTMLSAPLIVHVGPALLRGDPANVAAILIGNAILFALLVAELVQSGTNIYLFRRGA